MGCYYFVRKSTEYAFIGVFFNLFLLFTSPTYPGTMPRLSMAFLGCISLIREDFLIFTISSLIQAISHTENGR
jgi:hypothetical protein